MGYLDAKPSSVFSRQCSRATKHPYFTKETYYGVQNGSAPALITFLVIEILNFREAKLG